MLKLVNTIWLHASCQNTFMGLQKFLDSLIRGLSTLDLNHFNKLVLGGQHLVIYYIYSKYLKKYTYLDLSCNNVILFNLSNMCTCFSCYEHLRIRLITICYHVMQKIIFPLFIAPKYTPFFFLFYFILILIQTIYTSVKLIMHILFCIYFHLPE